MTMRQDKRERLVMKRMLRVIPMIGVIIVAVLTILSFRPDPSQLKDSRKSQTKSNDSISQINRSLSASAIIGKRSSITKARVAESTLVDNLNRADKQAAQNPSVPHVLINGHAVHPSRILLSAVPNTPMAASRHFLESHGLEIVDAMDTMTMVELAGNAEAPNRSETLVETIKVVRASGLFAYAEPDYVVSLNLEPTDAAYLDGRLWGLKNSTTGIDIDAARAWGLTTGSSNVIVAVIDTGIRYTHRDLASRMWRNAGEIAGNGIDDDNDGFIDNIFGIDAHNKDGDPMDDHSHGTHCAGTIGASANDGYEHVGVAWNVRLMACKFLSAEGSGYTSDAIRCIDWAVSKGAKVLSNSWGGGGYSQAMFDAIARAKSNGVLFVVAAGNDGSNNDSVPSFPANYDLDNVISVAAVDMNGGLVWWSNFGPNTVDLGAPGVGIYSTTADTDDSYAIYSGTSMACPHVAGAAALLLSYQPGITLADMRARLISTTRPLASLSGKTVSGGMLHVYYTLAGQGDGTLELAISADPIPLRGGTTAKFVVAVTDLFPVLGASVTGSLTGIGSMNLKDDGVLPDAVASDGKYTGKYLIPTDTALTSVQFVVQVSAAGKLPASKSATFAVVHPQMNDHFANRKRITSNTYTFSGAGNVNATAESGEPPHYNRWYVVPARKSVWFTWTATANGRVELDTRGSNFDTVLSVYTGDALTRLSRVAQDDDSGGNLTSRVRFNVTRNKVYQIAIDGYDGVEGNIQGRLRFTR